MLSRRAGCRRPRDWRYEDEAWTLCQTLPWAFTRRFSTDSTFPNPSSLFLVGVRGDRVGRVCIGVCVSETHDALMTSLVNVVPAGPLMSVRACAC